MESITFQYVDLSWLRIIPVYFALVFTAWGLAWLYIYLPGRIGFHLASLKVPRTGKKRAYDLEFALSVSFGLWICTSLGALAGVLGLFNLIYLVLYGVGAIAIVLILRLPLVKVPRLQFSFVFLSCSAAAILFGLLTIVDMSAWYDGNFVLAGGHLARTGKYLAAFSEGQVGMAVLTAMISICFPTMSSINTVTAWAPFYAPLFLWGMILLLREVFGHRKWDFVSLLFLCTPLAFRAHEIRGSVTGFGLAIWGLLFVSRYLRTKDKLDLLGAVATLASAWNFGQLGALYAFLMLMIWSIGAALGEKPERARAPLEVLLWINIVEWLHIALGFEWLMPKGTPFWRAYLPGSITLLILALLLQIQARLPRFRVKRAWLLLPFIGCTGAAYLLNPTWKPVYNWYFFTERASFETLNFSSYGLLGWILALALLLSLPDTIKKSAKKSSIFLWLAFCTSCIIQIVSPILIKSGLFILAPDRAYLWDLWKDTGLFWSNPLLVIGFAYCLESLDILPTRIQKKISIGWKKGAVACALVLCLHRLEPYRLLFAPQPTWYQRFTAFMDSQIEPAVFPKWKAQQIYTLPMYFYYSFMEAWHTGTPSRREDCVFCTVYSFGSLKAQQGLMDLLLEGPILPGDTLATGDSVLTPEVYLNRQVRYANQANTLCPVYLSYLNDATAYESFWKPENHFRRNSVGMAYTIVNPRKNLVRLESHQTPTGLEAYFNVPFSGDYEVYRGSEWQADKAPAVVDGQTLQQDDAPSLGWLHLDAGKSHLIQLKADSKPLQAEVPLWVYPRRDWAYERALIENKGGGFGTLTMTRFTGIPPAQIAVEEMREILTTRDLPKRSEILQRLHIRYLVIDPVLASVFPAADLNLRGDPAFRRLEINQVPTYLFLKK